MRIAEPEPCFLTPGHEISRQDSRLLRSWILAPERKIKSIVTSPPYFNRHVKYGNDINGNPIGDVFKNRDEYFEYLYSTFNNCYYNSTDDCVLWLNGPADHTMFEFAEDWISEQWTVQNRFFWCFSGTTPTPDGKEHSWGQFSPNTSKTKVHNCCEMIWQLHKTNKKPAALNKLVDGVPYCDESNLNRFTAKNNGKTKANIRSRGNLLCIPYETKQKREHPATFPVALAGRCMDMQTNLQSFDWVCDPYMGAGNAGVAAMQRGLNFVGMDLNLDYVTKATIKVEEQIAKNQANCRAELKRLGAIFGDSGC